jgi:release factor glutamine methyltransferase
VTPAGGAGDGPDTGPPMPADALPALPAAARAGAPAASPTLAGLLAEARALGVDRLDAQLLLAHHLARPRAWVLAHDDAVADAASAAAVRAGLRRRAAGEPLAYLTGEKAFHGLSLIVTPDVLVPRPDTETLVDWALECLAGPLAGHPAPRVLDLGTGSGAIALAVKAACPRADVHAVDLSPAALAVARANGERLGLAVRWWLGDWWHALPAGEAPFDLVLSNPPYIAAGDPHLPALAHEPALALTPPGGDGLAALRALATGAAPRLTAGGWLLLEHGHDQADAVHALLVAQGLEALGHRTDLGGVRRCTGGRRSQTAPAAASPQG